MDLVADLVPSAMKLIVTARPYLTSPSGLVLQASGLVGLSYFTLASIVARQRRIDAPEVSSSELAAENKDGSQDKNSTRASESSRRNAPPR